MFLGLFDLALLFVLLLRSFNKSSGALHVLCDRLTGGKEEAGRLSHEVFCFVLFVCFYHSTQRDTKAAGASKLPSCWN